jgi:alginate O-acetyltransferase complex protein AlgI
MLFCTQEFLAFFFIVFTAYWIIPWRWARIVILVGASFFFYAYFSIWLALLVSGTASLDWLLARGIETAPDRRRARFYTGISITVNLAVLCVFKYSNFFLDSIFETLHSLNVPASKPLLKIIVPFGISFYTFEAISYTVDVYQGRVKAERNLLCFLLFILFFPHLVAGPIVRGRDFLPQVRRPKHWSWTRFAVGGRLILLGLFKKMVIADRMALYVDPIFANPGAYESSVVWMAAIAYSLQIYCDFSGYSDIALGTARLLGYRLTINFMMPFASANITDFWRRWHMSLSSWIRDYIYIPLGGNRGSTLRTSFNLMFAMTLCGFWHGANWTFMVWGALNGAYLIAHRFFKYLTRGMEPLHAAMSSVPGTMFRVALTFTAVTLAFVLFRSPTFELAAKVFQKMFVPSGGAGSPMPTLPFWTLAGVVLIAHLIASGTNVRVWWERIPPAVRGMALASFLFVTMILPPETSAMFIYFQF